MVLQVQFCVIGLSLGETSLHFMKIFQQDYGSVHMEGTTASCEQPHEWAISKDPSEQAKPGLADPRVSQDAFQLSPRISVAPKEM